MMRYILYVFLLSFVCFANVMANENETFTLSEGGTLWSYCQKHRPNDVLPCVKEIMYANKEWFERRGVVWGSISDVTIKDAKKLQPGTYALPKPKEKREGSDLVIQDKDSERADIKREVDGNDPVTVIPNTGHASEDRVELNAPSATENAVHGADAPVVSVPDIVGDSKLNEQGQRGAYTYSVDLIPAAHAAELESPASPRTVTFPRNETSAMRAGRVEEAALVTDRITSDNRDKSLVDLEKISDKVTRTQKTLALILDALVSIMVLAFFAGVGVLLWKAYLHREYIHALHYKIKSAIDDSHYHKMIFEQTRATLSKVQGEFEQLRSMVARTTEVLIEDANGIPWEVEFPVSHIKVHSGGADGAVPYTPMIEWGGEFLTVEELRQKHNDNDRL